MWRRIRLFRCSCSEGFEGCCCKDTIMIMNNLTCNFMSLLLTRIKGTYQIIRNQKHSLKNYSVIDLLAPQLLIECLHVIDLV